MLTAYFEFWPTSAMTAYQFECRIKATKQLQGITLKVWSRLRDKTVYQATAKTPEDLLKLGMAIQVINDEIYPDETGINQSIKKTPTGGRALV